MAIFKDFRPSRRIDVKLLSDCSTNSCESKFVEVSTLFEKHRRKYREPARIIYLSIVNNISLKKPLAEAILTKQTLLSKYYGSKNSYAGKFNLTSSSIHFLLLSSFYEENNQRQRIGFVRLFFFFFSCNLQKFLYTREMRWIHIIRASRRKEARNPESGVQKVQNEQTFERGRVRLVTPCCCHFYSRFDTPSKLRHLVPARISTRRRRRTSSCSRQTYNCKLSRVK